jgi:diguanylate cyclase (GGDEF)-like protein
MRHLPRLTRLRTPTVCAVLLAYAWLCSAQRYTFRTYGELRGLSNQNVVSMLEDHEGFLWLGTDNGLFRFDGVRFVEFSTEEGLKNPYVVALAEDATGRLWAGTGGGLFYRDGQRFEEVRSAEGSMPIGLDGSLSALPDGRLLAVSRSRLFEVTPGGDDRWTARAVAGTGRFSALPAADRISSVFADRQGRIWVGCGDGICELHDGKMTRWEEAAGVPKDAWLAFYEDRRGEVWARSTERVVALRPQTLRWEDRTGDSAAIANSYYVSFGETAKGEVLTPSAEGLAVWKTGAWDFFGPQQGFSRFGVESLYTDKKGLVWIGVTGHGLARWLGYGPWESWTDDDGLGSPVVWGVLRDDQGRAWVADDKGISVSDPQHRHFAAVAQELGLGMTVALSKDRAGKIWGATNSGMVVRVDPGTLRAERFGRVPGANQIYADDRGHIWISTQQGLYEVDSTAAAGTQPQKVDVPGLDRGNIFRVVTRSLDGTLWAAGEEGLFVQEGDAWKRVGCTLPGEDGQIVNKITGMDFAPDGSLWADVNFSRVAHIALRGDQVISVDWMGPEQISSLATQFVRFDQKGRLWVGHDRGVDVFDGQRWRLLTSTDGLLWDDTDNKAFYADDDGSVWIGTSEGVSHFLGGAGNALPGDEAPTAPKIMIPGVDGDTLAADDLRIPWSHSTLQIQFSPLNYEMDGRLSYEYQLAGEDGDWVHTSDPQTEYSSLSPGHYTFRLRTIDDSTRMQSPVTEITFAVLPKWWQTWEFRVLIALLAVGMLAVAWRLRVRHLLHRQQELEMLVAARTHELEQQATHDDLTGLLNHKGILQMLMIELQRARRQRLPLAIVMADLDYFKDVNDHFGHLAGDSVLQEIGNRLRSSIRVYDKAGRYGGEEFLLLMPTLGGEGAMTRIEALRAKLTKPPYEVEGHKLTITCSFGVVLLDGQEEHSLLWNANETLAAADRALYRAKHNGRDRVEYASEEAASPDAVTPRQRPLP